MPRLSIGQKLGHWTLIWYFKFGILNLVFDHRQLQQNRP
jgi:hypothetical protein